MFTCYNMKGSLECYQEKSCLVAGPGASLKVINGAISLESSHGTQMTWDAAATFNNWILIKDAKDAPESLAKLVIIINVCRKLLSRKISGIFCLENCSYQLLSCWLFIVILR